MRLYIEDFNLSNINLNNILQYKTKTNNKNFIYSTEGIFEIIKNDIHKLKVVDHPIEKINIKKHKFICDKSYFKKTYNVNQIPYNHHLENIQQVMYQLHNKAKDTLVIEIKKQDNKITNLYFEINDVYTDYSIQEDILTFLSYLN